MTRPDFNAMTRKELRQFILDHRGDTTGLLDDAVHMMVLKIETSPDAITVNADEDVTPYIRTMVEKKGAI
jgi:C-terminal processing protease CtpA/Prc